MVSEPPTSDPDFADTDPEQLGKRRKKRKLDDPPNVKEQIIEETVDPITENVNKKVTGNTKEKKKEKKKGKLTGVTALHHIRFIDWTPTAVVSIAPSPDGTVVAVARESGDLELWETDDWQCLQVYLHTCLLK